MIDLATLAVLNAAIEIGGQLGLTRDDVLALARDEARQRGTTVAEEVEALGRMVGAGRGRCSA